jgi:hypothetical protein
MEVAMKIGLRSLTLVVAVLLVVGANAAMTQRVSVPQGTQVVLVFDQPLSSKTATVGTPVRLHVKNDVALKGHTILASGTKVTGVISKVEQRKRYGVNAKMRIALNPVKSTYGTPIDLMPRTTNKYVGAKTGKAAAATAGGAAVLGPVGLAGGYFIHGKQVNIKRGDLLDTEVMRAVVLTRMR